MRKVDYYFMISWLLFVVDIAIIPVGGFADSNQYHQYYISSFVITAVNTLISLLVLHAVDVRERRKREQKY